MSIDEAIKKAKEKADKHSLCWKHCTDIKNCDECENENKQIADWLEELKEARKGFEENRKAGYKHGYADGYAQAIDEFAERLKYEYGSDEIHETIDEIAEQMKKGDV